jgi:hypothetical protein
MKPGTTVFIPNMQPSFPDVSATVLALWDQERKAQVRITEGRFTGWLVSVSYDSIRLNREEAPCL